MARPSQSSVPSPQFVPEASIILGSPSKMLDFGAQEVERALAHRGYSVNRASLEDESSNHRLFVIIGLHSDAALIRRLAADGGSAPGTLPPQAYSITTTGETRQTLWAIGGDEAGAMYGALELAEIIRLDGVEAVTNRQHTPYLDKRGIKFNTPLDVRTPSYSDNGEHAWKNTAVVWEMSFWRDFLDDLARYRYNVVSLWNMHPFPSLVKVPEYPHVALTDVKANPGIHPGADLCGNGLTPKHLLDAAVTVKTMTIDEKIAFWRAVMEYGRDRGIEFYLFTWNIFFYGAEGKDGVTGTPTATSTDYYRKSVREAVLTYPLLAGIGITSGENMYDKGEEWMYEVYARGIMDAKTSPGFDPTRRVRLIHRLHSTGSPSSLRTAFAGYTDTLDLSYKYSQAHMHSTPNPGTAFLDGFPDGMQAWLTVRNDDFYMMRWGDPSYARDYLKGIPVSTGRIAGFYMGPDGYTWGREFISTEAETPRQLVIRKQWYSFMLWGRLAYAPDLPDDLFCKIVAHRFPQVNAHDLFDGWMVVSKILPLVTRAFWDRHSLDFEWYPEACYSNRVFESFTGFIASRPYDSSMMSIRAYTEALLSAMPITGTTPLEIAEMLTRYAVEGLARVAGMDAGADKELRLTLGDIAAMAHLGNYYAERIRGATEYHFFQAGGSTVHQDSAIAHLTMAADHWDRYAAISRSQYCPQILTRLGKDPVDVMAIAVKVREDIAIAKGSQPKPAAGADKGF